MRNSGRFTNAKLPEKCGTLPDFARQYRQPRASGLSMRLRRSALASFVVLALSVGMAQKSGRSVVLSGTAISEVASRFPASGPSKITGSWVATEKEIDALEADYREIVALSRTKPSGQRIDHPERYFRQYVPIVQAGQRRIYVNAFCGIENHKPSPYWRDRLVTIMDGGSCVWQAIYDVGSDKFIELDVNGLA
jgi:hypothetical protein